jgi:tetratricopeptide (TPR) repeat protein
LRDGSGRLDALDAGDLGADLRTVFASSYRALDSAAARTCALLALAPGPDIGLPATAALLGRHVNESRAALRILEAAHLVHQHSPGRYRMHDLVRLCATERAEQDIRADVRDAALRRLLGFYLHSSHSAERQLAPHRPDIELEPLARGCVPQQLPDMAAAMAWFDAEYPCLLAAQQLTARRRWHLATWQLTWTVGTYQWRRNYRQDRLATCTPGFEAAERLGDPVVESLAHRCLGLALMQLAEYEPATDHLQRPLTLCEETGDKPNQAQIHQTLGYIWSQRGDHRRALAHAENTLRLHRALGDSVSEANALNAVAWCLAQLGRHEDAYAYCEQALALFRKHEDRLGNASALDSLGYIAHQLGEYGTALLHYQAAAQLRRDIGVAQHEADTLVRMADTHRALGQRAEARRAWQWAVGLYRGQHMDAEAQRVQDKLDLLELPTTATFVAGQ